MPTARIRGVPLQFEDSGGDGPPVLFAHGFLMDHTMFEPQVRELAPDFRCVRFDARGFGGTPAPDPFDYWDLAGDAVGLLDHVEIESATFVGMSQGGFLALRAVLAHPDRVRALVLIDTHARADDPETRASYREAFDPWISGGPPEPVLEEMADLILGQDPAIREEWMARWREIPGARLRHPVECLLGREDVRDRLGEITCPALVVHGGDDVAIPPEHGEELAEALPGSEGMVRVPGAVHAPSLTHPDRVNPRLREFLERHG